MKTRSAAVVVSLFLLGAVPALAGWPSDLVKDGNAAIKQGEKHGNPLEVLGGMIERGLGQLFGGGHHHHHDNDGGGDGHSDQGNGNPAPAGSGSGDSGATAQQAPNPQTVPAQSGSGTSGQTASSPNGGAPANGAPSDSTSLVQKDQKPEQKNDGTPQGPQITYNGNSTTGGLIGVHRALGHAVFGDPSAQAGTPQVKAPDGNGAATQTVESSQAAAKKDSALDKAVGPIASVGGAKGDVARQVDMLIANAKSKIALGDFKGAVDDLTRAIALDPNNAQAWWRRAEAYNRLKKYDLARNDALQAIKLDPSSSGAHTQLAYADYKLGKLQEALDAANKAIALNPGNAEAYWIRALIKAKMGDMAGALRDLETAANLSAKFRDAWEKARESGRVVDPDDESSLGEEAVRIGLGLPLWAWALLALLVLAGATVAGVVALRAPKAAPIAPLARTIVSDPKELGRLAGKYEIKNLIGRGGMGNVYEALDHSLGRSVAVKKMSERLADMAPQARQMLVQEAKTVAQLHHPAVVDIYEILEEDGDLYLVFELVKGKTALHLLAESSGRLGLQRSLEILRPVCDALEFAHGRGMIHRDLKPANIMITEQGHVKLMDFGIARSIGDKAPVPAPGPDASIQQTVPAFAQTRTIVGTPQYMAPEIEQGIVSRQGDVYALGVCLYEMTTGRLPFADTQQKLSLQMMRPSQLNPALPAELDELVIAALQPDPNARLASAKDFLARFERAVAAAGAVPAKG